MYDNEHLQRVIDVAMALQAANTTNADMQSALAQAQNNADAAEAEVTRLTGEYDALTKGPVAPPAPAFRRR